jgi:PAS domain S-box-containing protein
MKRNIPGIKETDVRQFKYYRDIINMLPGHVYWKDKEGKFLGCNLEQAIDAGFDSPDEIIGKSDYDMPWSIQAEYLQNIDRSIMEAKESTTLEELFELPDGTRKVYLSRKMPLYDERKNVRGILGISVDITELKNTQDKLKKTEGRLDGMLVLSSSMAHELRTPLAAIGITATSLKNKLPTLITAYKEVRKPRDKDYISDSQLELINESIDIILSSVKDSAQFINMILTNVMSEEKHIGKYGECSIKRCIELSIEEYTFPIGNKGKINLLGIKDFKFYGDENLIKHVFFNLLKNALYFIEKSGKGEIQIWTDQISDYNQVYFKDTGLGIAEERLPKIFDQFFTFETHHGTGIGLAFCKLVMETIGGSIQCQSEQNTYTQFILSFPKIMQ